MHTTSRGHGALSTVIRYLLVTIALLSLVALATACGGGDDATPPPATVIRADETPAGDATATPTATPGTGEQGYPAPEFTPPPANSAYPEQSPLPGVTGYPAK